MKWAELFMVIVMMGLIIYLYSLATSGLLFFSIAGIVLGWFLSNFYIILLEMEIEKLRAVKK